jgi:hypothetical protein
MSFCSLEGARYNFWRFIWHCYETVTRTRDLLSEINYENSWFYNFSYLWSEFQDLLCSLMVRVPATDPEVQVRFPALPVVLSSNRPGKGCTQPRDCNSGVALVYETGIKAVGVQPRWQRDTTLATNLVLASPIKGGRSVGIVHSRIQATEFVCLLSQILILILGSSLFISTQCFEF